jgi:Lon-like ATP-dependent protease
VAVYDTGDHRFAKPSRITARTFAGRDGVINIERETAMSGAIHSKGVLILSGYLGGKYAHSRPLALNASIGFEQVYEEVDGDSASSTELYALLSSLANAPIKQGLAVTGSVNQHGEVQPIGGVNEKIEGFYATCLAQGLTGEQGVLIPVQNVQHLMLSEETTEAIQAGRFHVWAVSHIDQGVEILTGVTAGVRRDDGTYPPESIHGRVDARLEELAEIMRRHGRP